MQGMQVSSLGWEGSLERTWQPTPVFLPRESHGQGAWWAPIYRVSQSLTQLKWLSTHASPNILNNNQIFSFNKLMAFGASRVGKIFVFQSLSHVWLFATPWTAAHQAFLSFTISQSLLKLMSFELVMSSNHLIPWSPLLLLLSIFPSIRVFPNDPFWI